MGPGDDRSNGIHAGRLVFALMRAIVMRRSGGPEVLVLENDFPRPEPAPGQVLVEIRARGVHYADTETRRAKYRPTPVPRVLGSEGMGIVVAVGANVGADHVGRRVAWFSPQPPATGTYAEFAAVPAAALLRLPDTIDDLTAAAIPLQGITAHVLVHRAARVREGQTVLIHAAAGGIGLLAVQMAKRLGARVLGTVSSAAKAEAVRDAGGEPFVRDDHLVERVKAATNGRGVDLVLDSIGLPTQAASLAMLAPFGELLFFGDAGGLPAPVDPNTLYPRSLKVSAFGLDLEADPGATERARRELVDWAADGTLKFRIDRVLPLAEAAEAHRLLEAGANVGKIVLADPR